MPAASLQAVAPARPDELNVSPNGEIIRFPKRKRTHPSKGKRYPPDPLLAADIALMLEHCTPQGPQKIHRLGAARLRVLIAVLYRTGARISEGLDLMPSDIFPQDKAVLIRSGKGGKRRVVLMDDWGWNELNRWLLLREDLPAGYLFPVLRGQNAGGRWASCDVRRQLHSLQIRSGSKKRIACHQIRRGHAVELRREGVDLFVIKEQLGHSKLNTTAIYLTESDPMQLLAPIGERKPPMITIS